MNDNWYVSGCVVCGYTEHVTHPRDYCPNDGFPLARRSGSVKSWDELEELRERFRRDPVTDAIADGVRGVVKAVGVSG